MQPTQDAQKSGPRRWRGASPPFRTYGGLPRSPMPFALALLVLLLAPLAAGADDEPAAHAAPPRNVLHEIEAVVEGIATRVCPSVVEVHVVRTLVAPPMPPVRRSVMASGVVWDNAGHILSFGRMFEGALAVEIVFSDGRRAPADVVGVDEETGLTVLHAERAALGATWVPVVRGRAARLRAGSIVVQVGSPFGLGGSVALGNIAATDRILKRGDGALTGMLQVTTPVNPGDPGSALCDASGQLVGIVAAAYERGIESEDMLRLYGRLLRLGERLVGRSAAARRRSADTPAAPGTGSSAKARLPGRSSGSSGKEATPTRRPHAGHRTLFGGQSVGFAIPIEQVEAVAARLIESGKVERSWLGVQVLAVDAVLAAQLELPTGEGLLVVGVVTGGPAAKAGLRRNDILISFAGEPIPDVATLQRLMVAISPGRPTEVGLLRAGSPTKLQIVPTLRPHR